jgi:hypothetical protein
VGDARRQDNGRFGAGNNANPGGRKGVPAEVRKKLDDLLPAAVDELGKLLASDDEKIRIQAVKEALDRCLGKAPQVIDVTDMADEEILAELRRMAIESGIINGDEATEDEAAH